MYFKIKNQKEIIKRAIKKAGSYRKLSKILDIPLSSIWAYENKRVIIEKRFSKIINFLQINRKEISFEILEQNWKQIIGGKSCVESKKKKGTFKIQLKKAQEKGAIKFKEWHKKMKADKPEEYYLMQYNNFKKIGGYKYKTNKGEKVRNLFEKQVADILSKLNITYEYEPLIRANGKYFFPDFLINKKIIIECTSWKGETKAYKLKDKIKHLEKIYKVFVVIPKNLYSYYKILDDHLIVGLDEFVPVAQTFLSL